MTRDDIINHLGWSEFTDIDSQPDSLFSRIESLARKAEESEREACAKLCDTFKSKTLGAQAGPDDELSNVILRQVAHLGHAECAAAIRARSTP